MLKTESSGGVFYDGDKISGYVTTEPFLIN